MCTDDINTGRQVVGVGIGHTVDGDGCGTDYAGVVEEGLEVASVAVIVVIVVDYLVVIVIGTVVKVDDKFGFGAIVGGRVAEVFAIGTGIDSG